MIREFLYGTENYRQIISNSALHNFRLVCKWNGGICVKFMESIIEEQVINGLRVTHLKI